MPVGNKGTETGPGKVCTNAANHILILLIGHPIGTPCQLLHLIRHYSFSCMNIHTIIFLVRVMIESVRPQKKGWKHNTAYLFRHPDEQS